MEKRTVLAIILSVLVLLIYSYFFQPRPVQRPMEKAEPKQEAQETPAPLQLPLMPSAIEPVGEDVLIEADLYKAVLTNRGATIKSWELKRYKDKNGTPVTLLKEIATTPPLGILFDGAVRDLPQKIIYQTNVGKLLLSKDKPKGEVIFTYEHQGLLIRKKFIFYNNAYKVDLSIETINTPQYLLSVGTDFGIFDKKDSTHKGPVILVDSDREEFDEKLKESREFTGNIYWVAQEDKYFTTAIVPRTPILGAKVWKEANTAEIALKLASGKHDFFLYAGPKEYDRLRALGVKLEHIIDFGWFSIVAMPLFWILKFFYKFMGNYGWAIVLLTIIIRIPFTPLMTKSQKAMKKMQELQPKIAELREKYKKDPQKMQKELMGLYKKHKVNPMGGCLPILLQIPVFIALYNVLLKAIELRGAPFVWWIKDLSAKDPYYILPIVMGLTMVIQQKMTPSSMDPMQAKMMMILPIVFTFMFLTFPSGLVLYWLVNNIFGIVQQYYVNKKIKSSST